MDISTLKEAGLTDGEIKVYIAMLELGSSTTGPIIEKSGIARSIIYLILEKLMQKGLASFITKEKTKYFQAAEPQRILQYIGEREKRLKENKRKVEQLLPELLLKQQNVIKNEANFYTGFKGMITAHEHIYLKLKPGEEYYYLGIPSFQPKEHHLYWKKDHVKRIEEGLKCRLLFNYNTNDKVLKSRNSYKGCDARKMPVKMQTSMSILIYKDTVVIIIQVPTEMAVEIVNQQVADSFKAYFEEFWRLSLPFK